MFKELSFLILENDFILGEFRWNYTLLNRVSFERPTLIKEGICMPYAVQRQIPF